MVARRYQGGVWARSGPGLHARHPERAEWMARASREHGYTLSQIADEAGLHYGSVSKIIKPWKARRYARNKTDPQPAHDRPMQYARPDPKCG